MPKVSSEQNKVTFSVAALSMASEASWLLFYKISLFFCFNSNLGHLSFVARPPGKLSLDKVSPNEMSQEKLPPEKKSPDKVSPDEVSPDEASPDSLS